MSTILFDLEPRSSPWKYWLSTFVVLIVIPRLFFFYRRNRSLPPGPRGFPVIGNALQVPAQMPWFKFTDWAKEFGSIYSLNVAGQTIIVLNTFKTASDLLERRSNLYSDRPRIVMAGEIVTGGMGVVFAPYGEMWRKMRRAAHEGLGLRAAAKYGAAQAREAGFAVLRISEDSDNWFHHIERGIVSSVLTAVYGWPSISNKDEPIVRRIHDVGVRITEGSALGSNLVNIIPALKYLPLWMAKWKREALEWHRRDTELFEGFVKEVEEKMSSGTSVDCFASDLLKSKNRHGLTDKEAAWLAGLLFAAGTETTSTSLAYFIQAMVLYPDSMHKAQAELDDVVGRERIPTFDDRKNLPYVEALVTEVLRWRPVGPLAVPRKVTQDDWYEGYLIPKGATVIPNIWAMHRDPEIFPDFDDFRPERFLDGTTPEDSHAPMRHASFGFGRRICAGLDLANQMIFIGVATILWALDIGKAKDSDGNFIIPSKHDFVDAGIVFSPAPFRCKLSPRFPEAMTILQQEIS